MNTVKYSVCMMDNPAKPDGPAKAYGRVQINAVINTKKFIEHIADHNGVFSKGTVKGVTTDLVSCLREMLVAGNKVQIEGLGTFGISISCEPAENKTSFTANNIKSVNLTFTPAEELQNLKKDCVFEQVSTRRVQALSLEAERKDFDSVDLKKETV